MIEARIRYQSLLVDGGLLIDLNNFISILNPTQEIFLRTGFRDKVLGNKVYLVFWPSKVINCQLTTPLVFQRTASVLIQNAFSSTLELEPDETDDENKENDKNEENVENERYLKQRRERKI